MAWEDRSGGKYYYKKRRVGGRVVSEYIGAGFLAEKVAALDRRERASAAAAARLLQEQAAEEREIDAQLDRLEEYTADIVKAFALATGYHPHKGQWRKRRCR